MYLYKQVRPNIIAFRPNRETLGGTAYALNRSMEPGNTDGHNHGGPDKGGNVLIDCPAPTDDVCSVLEALGGVRWLILTHRTAMGKPGSSNACVAKLVRRFDCQVVIQEQEAYLLPDLPLQTFSDRLELTPDLTVIWTPGHTPGSSCVLYRHDGGVLFTGRHLLPNESGQLLPIRQPKTFHWPRQLCSIDHLLHAIDAPAPEWIGPGGNLGKLRGEKIMQGGRQLLEAAAQLSQQSLA
ncbi:MAG: MBL fold metallo-hydrolase [Cyanobacteria bacterium J06597_1]